MTDIVTIDFETYPIDPRPWFPPDPVGVALRWPCGTTEYHAWGHPENNNSRREDALAALHSVWRDKDVGLLFHNAKFDLAVATERLHLSMPAWHRVHDTQFLLFLDDPHSTNLSLKPCAERYLDWPAEEQDALHEWIWAHRQQLEEVTARKVTRKNLGAFIGYTPGDLCAQYAGGDVDRTWALFAHLAPKIEAEGMWGAYNRERQVLPILMENEREGIRVDKDRLEQDLALYQIEFDHVEQGLRSMLGAPQLNLDADRELADALSNAGLVDDDKWVRTKTGQRSVSKENLTPDLFNDPAVAHVLGYRNRLKTAMEMFMRPWLAQAQARGGWVSTNWNQVRDPNGGTRTGRPSTSSPNFLNIAKQFEGRGDGYRHPEGIPSAARPGEALMALPLVRKYMLPDPGHVWVRRDFANQEVRILGHYESGELAQAYLDNPDLDPHTWVKEEGERLTGLTIDRAKTKTLNFLAIYGGGVRAAAKKLGVGEAVAREYKSFHDKALPGRRIINEEILRRVRRGLPVWTWGGRRYYVRPPKAGQSYEYQLINYLCQGSAADLTKEALIDWYHHPDRTARFLVTVYDELDVSCPADQVEEQMALLRQMMDRDRLSVPMRSDGEVGSTWGDLEEYRDGPKPGDSITVWFSCGAASAVAAHLTLQKYGDVCTVRVVNNPVAEEDEDNQRFLRDVEQWLGVEIETATNPKFPDCSAETVWEKRSAMSFPGGAPCTIELKKAARQHFEADNPSDWIVLGFTAEEQKRHDNFVMTERDDLLPVLIDAGMSKQDCAEFLHSQGLELPKIYRLGYPNANCIGCVKATSPTYWNHVREVHPKVFQRRAEMSQRLGVRLVRVKGERIFLSDLDPEATGRPMKNMDFECGIFCEEIGESDAE